MEPQTDGSIKVTTEEGDVICYSINDIQDISHSREGAKTDNQSETQERPGLYRNYPKKSDLIPGIPYPVFRIGDYVPTKENNLWGYKQFDDWVIQPHFEKAGPFCDGIATVMLGRKYGFIRRDGSQITPYKYDRALSFYEGLAPVCLMGKWGCIDCNGVAVIPFKYDNARCFSEGLAPVCLMGKWGYIDCNGVTVIPFKYDKAVPFIDGLAKVKLGEKNGYIDKEDNWYESAAARLDSYRGFAKHFIEQRVNEWQRKGKYEKTEAWKARVTDENRKALIDSLIPKAADLFIAEQSKDIKTSVTVVGYDPDNEVFYLHDSRFGDLLVHVPINEAETFENHFDEFIRKNKYCIEGDEIGLAECSFTKGDKSYFYNNQASLTFSSININYAFESIDFDAGVSSSQKGKQVLESKTEKANTKADVDLSIPTTNYVNNNAFAVIIANEHYKREMDVEYAANDGTAFREYCLKTLGLPPKNVHMITDATFLDIKSEVTWLSNIANSYKGEAKLIFYYAGHGIPDESTRDAYLLPVDGTGTNTATGYALSELYANLGKYPTSSSMVFLDACFSGAQRDGSMLASARGVAIKPNPAVPIGNMIVFSAASGDETAYPYREKGHGLFTYFLLKKLQQSGGEATLGELADYISDNVGKASIVENAKSQTPTVIAATGILDSWKNLKIK